MAKTKISEFSSTAANNTDIDSINIAEGCAPSNINNAIRELMSQLKDQQTGASGDNFTVGGNLSIGGNLAVTNGTTFSASVVMSSTVAMNGNNNIGNTTSSTILSGSVTQTASSKLYLDDLATTSSSPPLSWNGDTNTGIYRPAADTLSIVTGGSDRLRINSSGVVIIGTGEATTSVTGNILRAPDGLGSNIVGANLEINAGNGTGTGGSGSLIFKTATADTSGSTANTLTNRLQITKNGGFSFGSGSTNYGEIGQSLVSNGDAPPSFKSSITSDTSQSAPFANTSSINFTSIPSWVKRITVMINGISFAAAGVGTIQIGSGSLTTTGYTSNTASLAAGGNTLASQTNGFGIINHAAAGTTSNCIYVLYNITGNTWSFNGTLFRTVDNISVVSNGFIALGGVLDRLSVVATTSTFDAGTVNIMWE